jgi:hypothetical protein
MYKWSMPSEGPVKTKKLKAGLADSSRWVSQADRPNSQSKWRKNYSITPVTMLAKECEVRPSLSVKL